MTGANKFWVCGSHAQPVLLPVAASLGRSTYTLPPQAQLRYVVGGNPSLR